MSERIVIVLAVKFRPRWLSRRKAADLALSIYRRIRYVAWAVCNPRFAWFAVRVRWHYQYGFPMPSEPSGVRYSIEA